MKQRCVLMIVLLSVLSITLSLPAGYALAASGSVQPPAGAQGSTFTFTATGMWDSEQVGVWLQDPQGTTWMVPERIFSDSSGQAVWTWTAPATAPGGAWEAHAKGFHSGEEAIIPFTLLAPETPPAITPSSLVLPASSGPPGTTFTFVARGQFASGEQVGSWFVQPDGTTTDVDQGISVDESGQIYRVWTAPANAMPGSWIFRAKGLYSDFTIDIPFSIETTALPVPTPTPAPSSNVQPERAVRGTTFSFTASGFIPGEQLGRWLISPDGTQYPLTPDELVYADSTTGAFSWTWTAPTDALDGRWNMNIRGFSSLVEWSIPFVVDGPVMQRAPEGDPVLSVSPASAPAGTRFRFSATGFLPAEKVFFWAIDSAGTPHRNDKEAEADATGAVAWSWEVHSDKPTGEWTMTARGDASRRQGQVTFTVTGPAEDAIQIEPSVAAPGTIFNIAITGLWSQEKVLVWLTPPEEATNRYDQPKDMIMDLMTDTGGNAWWTWTAPAETLGGEWHITARGENSRIERDIAFTIERDNPPPPAYGVSPASGPTGTVFTFFADNIPTDRAAYWVTAPDGTVVTNMWDYRKWMLSQTSTDRFEWTWTAPADAMPGVWTVAIRNLSDRPIIDWTKYADPDKREEQQRRYEENRRNSVLEAREYVIHVTVEP